MCKQRSLRSVCLRRKHKRNACGGPCLRLPPPTPSPPPPCAAAGLAREQEEAGTLQAELAKVQEEQARLPGLVREVQEALDAEAAAFQRQEAGARGR